MRAVIQRVSRATVTVQGRATGTIGRGFLVLLGVARGDDEQDAAYIADRVLGLRIFADSQGKMNLPLAAVEGALLVVSQFTLHADVDNGRRPSFIKAAPREEALRLYRYFLSLCRKAGVKVEEGEFGGMMAVSLVNDGPVTIIVESRKD